MKRKINTVTMKQGLMIIALAVTALIILSIAERVSHKISNAVKNWKEGISTTQEDMLRAEHSRKKLDYQE